MPPHPTWHGHLPEIQDALRQLEIPLLDRAMIERLFGIRRRQAIRLMVAFGGHQTGRAYLVDRDKLAVRIDALAEKRPVVLEISRRYRLEDALGSLRRESRPRTKTIEPAAGPGWPDGVTIAKGELRIAFRSPEELLGRILALTETAAADLDGFDTWLDTWLETRNDARENP